MELSKLMDMARAEGFETVAELDVGTLKFLPEVRDMCTSDRCRSFGRSWSCPPACGSLEEISAKCRGYTRGIIVQTVGRRDDEFDFESITRVNELNKARFARLADAYAAAGADCYPMGSGACTICSKCTYPDAPCRFEGKLFPSIEACGISVYELTQKLGMKYINGENTVTYFTLLLLP